MLLLVLQDSHLQINHAVEIIGKVQQDLSVKVMASTDMGPEGAIGESQMLTQSILACLNSLSIVMCRA